MRNQSIRYRCSLIQRPTLEEAEIKVLLPRQVKGHHRKNGGRGVIQRDGHTHLTSVKPQVGRRWTRSFAASDRPFMQLETCQAGVDSIMAMAGLQGSFD